jgi:hypothetical protein
VLAERPGEREVSVEDGPARISRKTQASFDHTRQLCRVNFDLERVDGAGRAEKWQEQHVVRYYFATFLPSCNRLSGAMSLSFSVCVAFPMTKLLPMMTESQNPCQKLAYSLRQRIGVGVKGLLSAAARGYLCELPADRCKPIRAAPTRQSATNYADWIKPWLPRRDFEAHLPPL